MRYTFEWDAIKAKQNLRKHGVSFDRAAELFRDPLAISIFDEEHSEAEERWVTIGRDSRGLILVAMHTFSDASAHECTVRMISTRKATKREAKSYEEAR